MNYEIQFYSLAGFAFLSSKVILGNDNFSLVCNVYSVIKIYFSFQDEFSISLKGISEDDSDFPDGF